MFIDTTLQFGHFDHSLSESFCSSSSSSSYSCNASDISAPWDSTNTTPACSPNRHIPTTSTVKVEDTFLAMDIPYEQENNFCSVGQVPIDFEYYHDTPPDGLFNSNHGLQLDMGFDTPNSCSSGIPENFVDPAQTTFIEESFSDLQSPFQPPRVDFDIQYTSNDEFDANFGFVASPQSLSNFPCYIDPKYGPTISSRSTPLRHSIHTTLASSTALPRIQNRHRSRREPTESRNERKCRQSESHYGLNIRIEKESTQKCPWHGCKGSFKRREHLKRHERTHIRVDPHVCLICQKPFDRTDNLKAHTKLHNKPDTDKTKSSRTRFDPRAAAILAAMAKRSKRAKSVAVSDTASDS